MRVKVQNNTVRLKKTTLILLIIITSGSLSLATLSNKYSASSLKSGFFSFLVKVANSAIISQVCVIES